MQRPTRQEVQAAFGKTTPGRFVELFRELNAAVGGRIT